MKKIYIILMITFFASHLLAQDTSKIEQYCQLTEAGALLSGGVQVYIDFGQKQKSFSNRGRILSRDFNSVVDALNFMGFRGWVLVSSFQKTLDSSRFISSYIFKKTCYKAEIVQLKMELEELTR